MPDGSDFNPALLAAFQIADRAGFNGPKYKLEPVGDALRVKRANGAGKVIGYFGNPPSSGSSAFAPEPFV